MAAVGVFADLRAAIEGTDEMIAHTHRRLWEAAVAGREECGIAAGALEILQLRRWRDETQADVDSFRAEFRQYLDLPEAGDDEGIATFWRLCTETERDISDSCSDLRVDYGDDWPRVVEMVREFDRRRWVSTSQAARTLACTPKHVRALVRAGTLPNSRRGPTGAWRCLAGDVLDYKNRRNQ